MVGSTIKDGINGIGNGTGNVAYDVKDAYKAVRIKKKKNKDHLKNLTFDELIDEFKRKDELAAVGAGIGGGFINTKELHVMKYKEAMSKPDRENWVQAVKEEHDRFLKYGVFKPVKIEDVPRDAKVITTTLAMKKKSNGTYRARLKMRGYEQVDGQHYDEASISSPVTNDTTIRIVLVLM